MVGFTDCVLESSNFNFVRSSVVNVRIDVDTKKSSMVREAEVLQEPQARQMANCLFIGRERPGRTRVAGHKSRKFPCSKKKRKQMPGLYLDRLGAKRLRRHGCVGT